MFNLNVKLYKICTLGCCQTLRVTIGTANRYFSKNTGSSSYTDMYYAWRTLAFNFW
jgi:hypothetical protein